MKKFFFLVFKKFIVFLIFVPKKFVLLLINYICNHKLLRVFEKSLVINRIFKSKRINYSFLSFYKLSESKKTEIENCLKKQIVKFKKKKKKTFYLLEIGSFYGESLEFMGNILENQNIDFHLISIDQYKKYNTRNDEESSSEYKYINRNIEKIYLYFLHNISLKKFREKFIHIRKSSKDGLVFLESINLKFDFIYIDGSHLYENFKNDYNLSKKIIVRDKNYSGQICGDDYEMSLEECHKIGMKKDKFRSLLMSNKNRDCLIFKEFNLSCHPGITLFFSQIKNNNNIVKTESNFWYLKKG